MKLSAQFLLVVIGIIALAATACTRPNEKFGEQPDAVEDVTPTPDDVEVPDPDDPKPDDPLPDDPEPDPPEPDPPDPVEPTGGCESHDGCAPDEYCDAADGCIALSPGWARDDSGLGAAWVDEEDVVDPPVCEPVDEIEDGVDNDCNGLVDEGFPCVLPDLLGACAGWLGINDGLGACLEDAPLPVSPEGHDEDGIDNDCNGAIDDLQELPEPVYRDVDHGEVRCVGNDCELSCEGGWQDVDRDADNGCEWNFACDPHPRGLPSTDGFEKTFWTPDGDIQADLDCDGQVGEIEPYVAVIVGGGGFTTSPPLNHLRDGLRVGQANSGTTLDCWADVGSFEECNDDVRIPGSNGVCMQNAPNAELGFRCGSFNERWLDAEHLATLQANARSYVDVFGVADGRRFLTTLRHDLSRGEFGEIVRVGSYGLSIQDEVLYLHWNGDAIELAGFPAGALCSFGLAFEETEEGFAANFVLQDVEHGDIVEGNLELEPLNANHGDNDKVFAFTGVLDTYVAWQDGLPADVPVPDLRSELVRLDGVAESEMRKIARRAARGE